MFANKLHQVLFLFIVNGCYCQRRIKDGDVVKDPKRYMVRFSSLYLRSLSDGTLEHVRNDSSRQFNFTCLKSKVKVYLVKAPVSPKNYDGWLCGGALVSTEYIVTSAACVSDVIHLYAIAGYNKYVRDTEINNDACTKAKKKKVVLICTPQAYELKYEEIEKWSFIDIAVVKVESPYDFADETYSTICSYTPNSIIINYEAKYQEAKVDAIVFGWGHKEKYRKESDPTDLNQEELMYAPTLIQDKEECKKEYLVYKGMDQIIDKYMICTFDKGNINDAGMTIVKAEPTAEGCVTKLRKLRGSETLYCENADNPGEEIALIETRKDNKLINDTIDSFNQTYNNNKIANVDSKLSQNIDKKIESYVDQKLGFLSNDIYRNVLDSNNTHNDTLYHKEHRRFYQGLRTRRQGICQNDHGGPLVTWVGSHEVLIGVASVFKITESRDCIGPYLFTSTQCNGAFLDCILQSDKSRTADQRRAICENEYGFNLVETQISWEDHPDGPAENEKRSADSNLTYHATIDLKFKKQQPNDIHATSNTSSIFHNVTSTNQVSNKTGPFNNGTFTDKNLVDATPANLTNVALKLLTDVKSIHNLNDLSSEINKTAFRLELKSASSIDLHNVTSSNLTSTTPPNAINITSTDFTKSTPGSIQNVNSSIPSYLSNITLSNVTNAVSKESTVTTILTSTVSAEFSNTTTSKPTSRSAAS